MKISADLQRAVVPPIIFDDHGDVELFKDLESVIQDVEPIDVKHEQFRYYDSTGRQLLLSMEGDEFVVRDGGLTENGLAVLREDLQHMLREIGESVAADAVLGCERSELEDFDREKRCQRIFRTQTTDSRSNRPSRCTRRNRECRSKRVERLMKFGRNFRKPNRAFSNGAVS